MSVPIRQEAEAPEPARLLSIKQVCGILGLSRTTLYGEMAAGRLRSVTIGRRRLVPQSAIDEFIAGLPNEYRRPA